jgi:hypothetical protein
MADADKLFEALHIPESCVVNRRIPKRRLIEEAPTAADRRRITDGVEQLQWRAVLRPSTTGIAGFRDEEREVEELSVLELRLRPNGQQDRTVELVHRAIPYLLLILIERGEELSLSLADKRWSLAEKSKMVLEGGVLIASLDSAAQPDHVVQLVEQLALTRQPQASLYSVYLGWINALVAFRAAEHTGRFSMPESMEHAKRRRQALKRVEMLDAEMATLKRAADREPQMARRAEINLRLQQVRSERATEFAIL